MKKTGVEEGVGGTVVGKSLPNNVPLLGNSLNNAPRSLSTTVSVSSAAYTLIHTHHYNLAKGPKSPMLSKEGDEGAFQSNAHTRTRGQVDEETPLYKWTVFKAQLAGR